MLPMHVIVPHHQTRLEGEAGEKRASPQHFCCRRLSFNKQNNEVEKLQAELEAREARRAAAAAAPDTDGKAISDEALAAE